ncbi:glycosyltransferase family 9 protein [bacterium]|nr:glycosyltransferase family 9 protein [bacterium]
MRKLKIDKSKVNKVLILALPGIGDTLQFTPALSVIRRNFPQAYIKVIVMIKGSHTILSNNPNIDELVYWNFMEQGFQKSLGFVLKLRKEKFPLTIFAYPSNRLEYNGINFMIGSKWRPTHEYLHMDFKCGGYLNHQVIKENNERHNVMENLYLLREIGLDIEPIPEHLELFLSDDDKKAAESFLEDHDLIGKRLVGFHAGGSVLKDHEKKRWPPENFIFLGTLLKEKAKAEVLVFGGPGENDLKRFIASGIQPPGLNVSGTSMTETAAIMGRCALFISNDTSLMHVAAALEVPTVGLFGPTNYIWDRPYGTKHKVVTKNFECSPCYYYSPKHIQCSADKDFQCLKAITPEEVFDACMDLLQGKSA